MTPLLNCAAPLGLAPKGLEALPKGHMHEEPVSCCLLSWLLKTCLSMRQLPWKLLGLVTGMSHAPCLLLRTNGSCPEGAVPDSYMFRVLDMLNGYFMRESAGVMLTLCFLHKNAAYFAAFVQFAMSIHLIHCGISLAFL